MGVDSSTLELIDANEAAIEAAGVVQHSYTAPGDDHGIFEFDRFYEIEVNGVTPGGVDRRRYSRANHSTTSTATSAKRRDRRVGQRRLVFDDPGTHDSPPFLIEGVMVMTAATSRRSVLPAASAAGPPHSSPATSRHAPTDPRPPRPRAVPDLCSQRAPLPRQPAPEPYPPMSAAREPATIPDTAIGRELASWVAAVCGPESDQAKESLNTDQDYLNLFVDDPLDGAVNPACCCRFGEGRLKMDTTTYASVPAAALRRLPRRRSPTARPVGGAARSGSA